MKRLTCPFSVEPLTSPRTWVRSSTSSPTRRERWPRTRWCSGVVPSWATSILTKKMVRGGSWGPHPSYKEITPALLREWWLKPILLALGKGWVALWEVASCIPAAFLSQISAVLITCKLYLLLKAMGNLLCGSPPAGCSLSSVDLCLEQLTQRIFICQECTGEMSKLCSSPEAKV